MSRARIRLLAPATTSPHRTRWATGPATSEQRIHVGRHFGAHHVLHHRMHALAHRAPHLLSDRIAAAVHPGGPCPDDGAHGATTRATTTRGAVLLAPRVV